MSTDAEYQRQQASSELLKAGRFADSDQEQVIAHGLAAITHALLLVAGRPAETERLRELKRQYTARQTDTRYGGQGGDHAAGYALAMKHAAELLGKVIDGLDER
jgi:hypothetical protein